MELHHSQPLVASYPYQQPAGIQVFQVSSSGLDPTAHREYSVRLSPVITNMRMQLRYLIMMMKPTLNPSKVLQG